MTLSASEDPAAIRKMQKKAGLNSLNLLFSLFYFYSLRREKHVSLPLHDSFLLEHKISPKTESFSLILSTDLCSIGKHKQVNL